MWPKEKSIQASARSSMLLALLMAALAGGCEAGGEALPALGVRLDQTSVSGLSSGAYMAGQFQLAHSRMVIGAALIAGGPYGCAESLFADVMPGPGTAFLNLSKAVNGCMRNALQAWGVPNVQKLAERARQLAAAGRIDAVEHVREDRVYLFSGTEDRTVMAPIVAAAAAFYEQLGVPPERLAHVTAVAAGHAFVTKDKGGACNASDPPYIVNCAYDQAGALLHHIHGPLAQPAASAEGEFLLFNQREFTDGLVTHGMDHIGVVYIPAPCRRTAGCRVHIAFHACKQNRTDVGDAFVRDTGLVRWAETNRFVVLFPQASRSPTNPSACWDWWGYTGHDFLTRQAPQIIAVHRMLERLAQRRTTS